MTFIIMSYICHRATLESSAKITKAALQRVCRISHSSFFFNMYLTLSLAMCGGLFYASCFKRSF